MFIFGEKPPKKDLGGGIVFQALGSSAAMNAWHWNMADKSVVKRHRHKAEQFGYVIKGGFKVTIGEETAVIKAGDAYFIPSGVPHEFLTIGETEAIDVFSPARPPEETPR